MDRDKITIYVTERDGKSALWVQREGEKPYNIWDLPHKHVVPEVLSAIKSAIERGMLLERQEVQRTLSRYVGVENK